MSILLSLLMWALIFLAVGFAVAVTVSCVIDRFGGHPRLPGSPIISLATLHSGRTW